MTEMPKYEREAREAVAKAIEAADNTSMAARVRDGKEATSSYVGIAIRAILPLLRTSDLERMALVACERYSTYFQDESLLPVASSVRDIGRESLEEKRTKGPWRLVGSAEWPSQRPSGVRYRIYNDATGEGRDYTTREAAENAIAEQNEKASHDAR